MKRKLCILLILINTVTLFPQGTDIDYERVTIGDARNIICGLDLSPDQTELAISSTQSFPFYIFDWKTRQPLKKFNVGNWYAGSSVEYSVNGKYIVLNQLHYVDWAMNKDKQVNFDIVNAQSGEKIKRIPDVHSVKISSDEQFAIALNGDEVGFYKLPEGKKEKYFMVDQATNSVAVSPDGKLIVVSHQLYKEDAANIAQLQRDKKSLKNALKYKQQLTVYDAATFKKLYTVGELYDIVYKLKFTKDGKNLLVLNIPHQKIQNTTAERQTYINLVDMETGKPKRRGFTSKAIYEPDFKMSHDEKLIGIVSQSGRFLELHLYDFETGKMLYRFQQAYRLFEKNETGMIVADSRTSFVFLPDNETVVMTMGNHLVYWNFNKKDN